MASWGSSLSPVGAARQLELGRRRLDLLAVVNPVLELPGEKTEEFFEGLDRWWKAQPATDIRRAPAPAPE